MKIKVLYIYILIIIEIAASSEVPFAYKIIRSIRTEMYLKNNNYNTLIDL